MNEGIKPLCVARDSLPRYQAILLAVDSSDHANRGIGEAAAVAGTSDAQLTAVHVYAAAMHDMRFRQMEGGLPEPFREERELERQRDVHDDLIRRGLAVITDSYLEQAERVCKEWGLRFAGCSLEGKNYRALVTEANSGRHDLLVIGALGLGAVPGSRLGTVCRRVVRRTAIDALVIKEPQRSLRDGPIVVALDGSTRSYGGLMTALALARDWNVAVHAVAAYDPHYHYVAFNRIAGVLSEEASKVFRFKEQERLHEEIIDSGLAKIYQGHLEIAKTIARDHDREIEAQLLAGKPHAVITQYLRQVKPSLLVIGKLGIHADADLDIGGNAENLLIDADCAVLLSQREHRPRVDIVADVAISWTKEAQAQMQKVPSFACNMAKMAVLRYAQERGHTVITGGIVEEATAMLCPGRSPKTETHWNADALARLRRVPEGFMRTLTRQRVEAFARHKGVKTITPALLDEKYAQWAAGSEQQRRELAWEPSTWERVQRIPAVVRGMVIKETERCAQELGIHTVTAEVLARAHDAWSSKGTFHSDVNPGQYCEQTKRQAGRGTGAE